MKDVIKMSIAFVAGIAATKAYEKFSATSDVAENDEVVEEATSEELEVPVEETEE